MDEARLLDAQFHHELQTFPELRIIFFIKRGWAPSGGSYLHKFR